MIRDQALPAVVVGLRRARAGIRGRLIVRDALIALALVAGVVIGWRLVASFVPAARVWLEPYPLSATAVVAGALVVVAVLLLAAGLHIRRATPTVLDLAIQADRRYDLQERLSTALESTAPGAGGMAGSLEPLLLADAAAAGERVDSRALVQVPLARPAGWLAVALALAVAAQFAPLRTPPIPAPATQTAAETPDANSPLPTVTDVQRAAALVAQDAFVRSDAKLQDVAAALQDLGARMAQGRIDPAQLASEVGRLRLQLREAYGQGTPETVSKGRQVATGTPPSSGAVHLEGSQTGQPSPSSSGPAPKVAQKDTSSSLSDLVQQLEAGAPNYRPSNSPAAQSLNKLGSTPSGGGFSQSYSYSRNNPQQNALFEQQNALLDQPGAPGGQPAGAARHATKGPGDAAGNGAQPLSNGANVPDAGAVTGADSPKVVLPDAQLTQGGKRIQLDAAPDAKRTDVVDVAPGAAVAGAPPSETALPGGPILDGQERDVLGRYFLPTGAVAPGGLPGTETAQ